MESVARARRSKLCLFLFQKGGYCVPSDATFEKAITYNGLNVLHLFVFAMLQLLPKQNFRTPRDTPRTCSDAGGGCAARGRPELSDTLFVEAAPSSCSAQKRAPVSSSNKMKPAPSSASAAAAVAKASDGEEVPASSPGFPGFPFESLFVLCVLIQNFAAR